ncbi:hypothetical protein Y88_3688 [Novosphingobium nitrogenifigens DSM 19370]|uniref:Surface lipoprotein assembly modifier C-terminal domain-containing protein n=1 Tax=Novosphingobium nitrogenifigens DSM 19370 TaxID=983920 RepID=F1ZDN7_9SPHN|nr:surface lipoprotein assembly modifier [Novosphingobium nitrogenifigens]EGD57379.1 hypothetical protein Y88_3688 [Novosphingobium nitrogenifigens DSM 19370]
MPVLILALAPTLMAVSTPALPPFTPPSPTTGTLQLSPVQMFDFAEAASKRGDYDTAERALRALIGNPGIDIRCEARFRLARLLAGPFHRRTEAALLLRRILDEKPNAAPVRLELARLEAEMGRTGAAGRELRAAQAIGLPADIARMVRFYQQALEAQRPMSGSIELALAPDSNVNRATTASTMGTVIGDFTLSRDARATSGMGLVVRTQAFARLRMTPRLSLLARLSGSASLYRDPGFDDEVVAPQIGPEWSLGDDRVSLSGGAALRWYGGRSYTTATTAAIDWQHRLGKRGLLRVSANHAFVDNHRNALETGSAWGGTAGLDRAFSARFGGGLSLFGNRQDTRDPGYATTSFGFSPYVFREIGRATVTATLSYSHLAADARIALFNDRRRDQAYGLNLAATLRQIRIGSLSPLLRLRLERNASTVQLYDYKRVAGEVGIASAF